MAASTCVKCAGTVFEVAEVKPVGGHYKLVLIQCAGCGGVIGVQDYVHVRALIQEQNRAIKAIAQKVGLQLDLS
jgi:hypothetical protein